MVEYILHGQRIVDTALRKARLRSDYLAHRQTVSEEVRLRASEQVKAAVPGQLPKNSRIVAGYAAIRGEIDIFPLLETLRAQGITVALPVMEAQGKPLLFREWQEGAELVRDHFGVRCPKEGASLVVPDVALVPLLAFTAARHRLGYGGGYYDRTLVQLRKASPEFRAYGIAYACQQAETLPVEEHDVALDAIFTENGVIR